MPRQNLTDLEQSGTSFFLTRVIHAAPDFVWRAWTDPAMLSLWWGPRGFRNRCEVDLRVGGKFRIVMISEEGTEQPLHGVFLEVRPIARLVMRVDLSEEPPAWQDAVNAARGAPGGTPLHGLTWVITFERAGSDTILRVENRFDLAQDRDGHIKLGAYEGWSESFERLDELLESPR